MRIAVVHSFYRSVSPSGENTVVCEQVDLLRSAGHEVLLVGRASDDLGGGALDRLRVARDVAFGKGADPTPRLREFAPDVVHVHNLFPNFATDWLARWPGPLVATVHNFRPVCANAVLIRDGRVCTLCPDGDRWAGVRHGCYRDSRVASIPIAIRNRRGIGHDPLLTRADRVILLSPWAGDLYVRFGLPADTIDVVPNAVAEPDPAPAGDPGHGCIAFGRLTAEKNWSALLHEWPSDQPLDIFGSGPLLDDLARAAPPGVSLRGPLDHAELLDRLPHYRVAVFSGVNPEGAYPLTALEAWAAGLPLVARDGGTVAAMIRRWGGGAVFQDRSDLPGALQRAADISAEEVRQIVRVNFGVEAWIESLVGVYEQAQASS